MEKQKLLEQERKAFLKYRKYAENGKNILAFYWRKKKEKLINKEKLADAHIKRKIKANGITKLNTITI